jgi:pimeloyl-ACP methyl ester carboxylesterase
MGGYAALITLGEHPDAGRGLVLVDIGMDGTNEGMARVQEFMESGLSGFESIDAALAAVAAYNPHRRTPPNPAGLMRNLREREGRLFWHWDPAVIGDRSGRGELPDQREERARRAAAAIRVPSLVVRGAQSDVLTVDGARELLKVIPHAGWVDVSGAGHMVSGDDNDAFTAAVADFLRRHFIDPATGR